MRVQERVQRDRLLLVKALSEIGLTWADYARFLNVSKERVRQVSTNLKIVTRRARFGGRFGTVSPGWLTASGLNVP